MRLLDTLRSLVTGLGGAKDKSASQVFGLRIVDAAELNAMHRSDWLARKIVDIIPNDMTRAWRDWQAEQDQIEKIEAVEKLPQINIQVKLNEALRKARLLGGAGLYLGMKDNKPSEPLDIERVSKGDLQYVHVLTRLEVTTGERIRDIRSEWFNQPSYYEINAGGSQNLEPVRIHPSRFIRFVGADILDTTQAADDGWGDSILQVVYDAIQNAASSQQHTASMIPEAKTDVIYIPNLSDYLQNATTTKQLTDRFTYANTIKSMFNMVLLQGTGGNGPNDGGERWEQKQLSFAQLPELIRQFLQIASAAADIPITRLLGESPGGLNSTGDGDLKNYHDNIGARQTNELQPAINRLDEVTIRSALGSRPAGIYYTWSPLEQMSKKEEAEIFKAKVEAARQIVGAGGTSPALMPVEVVGEALANELIEDGSLSGLEAAIKKYGLAVEEPDEEEEEAALGSREQTADAAPRTLYVRRDVLNGDEIVAWAKGQGFTTTLPAEDLHVTIAFSRTPIDWMKVGEAWSFGDAKGKLTVDPGGPRMMERFGEATVLLFSSSDLQWRHLAIREAGASWDHPEYQPHITISYKATGLDFENVEPYRGKIELGPEIVEEVKEDWQNALEETKRTDQPGSA
jgi:hypothetical protein